MAVTPTRSLPLALAGLALGLALAGCNKSDKNPPTTGATAKSDTPAPATAAVAPTTGGGGCGAGAFESKEGGFCLNVPAELKADAPNNNPPNTEIKFRKGTELALTVWYRADDNGGDYVAAEQMNKTPPSADAKVEASGALDGRKGFFRVYKLDTQHHVSATVAGKGKRITCEAETYGGKLLDNGVIDACKSLHAL